MIVLLAPKICCRCGIETCQGKVTTLLDSKLICHNNGMSVVGKFNMVIRKRRLGVVQALVSSLTSISCLRVDFQNSEIYNNACEIKMF